MLRFNLFGFPVAVEPWFWLVTALLGAQFASGVIGLGLLVIWIIAVLISILWHELGHAFFQRKFGGRQVEIRLHAMGGYATAEGNFSRQESIIISLAGPGAGLLLCGLVYFGTGLVSGTRSGSTLEIFSSAFLSYMLWINCFWSIVNLVPVLPLDGGRVLEAATDRPRAWVYRVSFVAAIITGIALFVYTRQIFPLVMFGFFAYQNFRALQEHSGWMPVSWQGSGSGPTTYREGPRPTREAKPRKKYEPKIRPKPEIDREHPAVVEIDALLEKISKEGFASLTAEEKQALDRASAELKEKDKRL